MTAQDFFDHPILNSPYEAPSKHHALEDGRPTGAPPVHSRRRSAYDTPVPGARRGRKQDAETGDLYESESEYNDNPIVNRIRDEMEKWRALPREAWGVTPTTARLLDHWRRPQEEWTGLRPFFCQREAVETVVWLTEVARGDKRHRWVWDHIEEANEQANPDLLRLAMKMATGAGKTTVMAMLIAWQTANAVRSSSKRYAKGFLLIAPGITIRDRLRVLDPSDPDSYYASRDLVPRDLMDDVAKAKVVITNYHAFQRRERTKLAKGTRAALEGRAGEPLETLETEGQMLQRACGDLLGMRGVVVINDEAHHCYRRKPDTDPTAGLTGEDKKEAAANDEEARLWISGIEALTRKADVRAIYDLSATPFFLKGSGYTEGTLFPWVVSDFSLMDAIECGIVKLPRVPVLDNTADPDGKPMHRYLWEKIGKKLPKKGRSKAGPGDPTKLTSEVPELPAAIRSLYGHYEETHEAWKRAGIPVPPVFIVVCNNTATSQLVHDWIAGFDVPETDDEGGKFTSGNLPLFSNYDEHGQRLDVPRTLLIDSAQIDSGGGIDKAFRDAMAPEIERFRQEKARREGAGNAAEVSDEEVLREVMNTVGEVGRLGEQIRCVVSVSMLTEGWDANTVTHIMGVRAFGTQLLCEQVVGRGLRRQSYQLQDNGLFKPEYADIFGIPFDFTAKPTKAEVTPPQNVTSVRAVRDREALALTFPNVTGYRSVRPGERITARFTEDNAFEVNPGVVGATQTVNAGVQGEQVTMAPEQTEAEKRPSHIVFSLANHIYRTQFAKDANDWDMKAFNQIRAAVSMWRDQGLLRVAGEGAFPAMVIWPGVIDQAADRIFRGLEQADRPGEPLVSVMIDPFNPKGSTRHVGFTTTKPCFETDPAKCHISHVVEDSTWEAEFARVAEAHPRVLAYAKNQGLGFEVPWQDGTQTRAYVPDFLLRVDDGRGPDDPLMLVAEVKGLRDDAAKQKADTMRRFWVPGVNADGRFGRWAYAEFLDVWAMQTELGEKLEVFLDAAIKARPNEA